ncbi:hypothetical protein B2J93_3661 [Marssonina coronariae]|uniref:MYND-type domain-containing protein n=1 Tax=Diplocarpon coronariae TaxID=2795749 RepID=A0A218Z726_9HELO|nr:hypothetical protein B2J93_3661 [Marssonina coronariae]
MASSSANIKAPWDPGYEFSDDASSDADSSESDSPTCATCFKPESQLPTSLKRCAKCHTAQYCSRDCQKEDWKAHKRVCGKPVDQHNPGFHAINGLLGLSGNDYLHSLPEEDVFTQLIDCYRLRVDDEYTFTGEVSVHGLYGGANPLPDFKRFLDKAEKAKGILPEWWNQEKRKECVRAATGGDSWANIKRAVEKSDIMEHYKNPIMPMILRVLGEKIYGKGFM